MLPEDAFPNAREIGVVSDTHLPRFGRGLPEELLRGLQGVDLILHAGDLVTLAVLEPLRKIAPVVAVHGNMDGDEVRQALPARRIVVAGGCRIGLVHGDSGRGRTTPERALNSFTGVDAVVFGHSHAPLCEEHDGVLLFNPGSPTDKRTQRRFSYGVLNVDGALWGEIRWLGT